MAVRHGIISEHLGKRDFISPDSDWFSGLVGPVLAVVSVGEGRRVVETRLLSDTRILFSLWFLAHYCKLLLRESIRFSQQQLAVMRLSRPLRHFYRFGCFQTTHVLEHNEDLSHLPPEEGALNFGKIKAAAQRHGIERLPPPVH